MTGRESRDNDHSLQCESDDPSIMKSLKGHKNKITKVKFLLNKKYLISSSQDGTLMFWTMSNKKRPVRFIGHEDGVLALACAESKNSYGSGENPGVAGRIASAGMDRSLRTWTGTS
jgi:centriolar protein POC1